MRIQYVDVKDMLTRQVKGEIIIFCPFPNERDVWLVKKVSKRKEETIRKINLRQFGINDENSLIQALIVHDIKKRSTVYCDESIKRYYK